jgi:hypothetical protein
MTVTSGRRWGRNASSQTTSDEAQPEMQALDPDLDVMAITTLTGS